MPERAAEGKSSDHCLTAGILFWLELARVVEEGWGWNGLRIWDDDYLWVHFPWGHPVTLIVCVLGFFLMFCIVFEFFKGFGKTVIHSCQVYACCVYIIYALCLLYVSVMMYSTSFISINTRWTHYSWEREQMSVIMPIPNKFASEGFIIYYYPMI